MGEVTDVPSSAILSLSLSLLFLVFLLLLPPSPSSMTIHIDWGSQQCLGHVDTVFFVAVNGWLCCNGCVASCFVCRIFSVRFVFMNVVQFVCRRRRSSVVISIVLLTGLRMTYFVFPTF